VVELVTDPEVAVIVVVPWTTPVANPELSIVAIPVAEELQVTKLLMSSMLPSA
jgi:hypothetical protein